MRTLQAAPQCGTADQAADIAPSSPEASKTAESENAAQEPLTPAAPIAEPIPTDAASPELDQAVFAKAAELGRQPGFQANATHLELAYRIQHIMVVPGQGELAIPRSDREAVRRFVDEVFFATQFLDEDLHAKARARRPNAAHQRPATGRSSRGSECDNRHPNSGAEGEGTGHSQAGSVLVNTGFSQEDENTLDAEARRIAAELVRLHKAGAIESEQDASFYAHLIRDFGASFTVRTGPVAANAGAPNGRTVPEPGKPYTPTAEQRVEIPRGLSRKREAQFLARDLEEGWPRSRRRRNPARA